MKSGNYIYIYKISEKEEVMISRERVCIFVRARIL